MSTVLDAYITSSTDTRGGKPRLAGTRITISDIALMHLRLGMSLEQIAARYNLSLAALHAGMAYYYDNRAEIDRQMEQEEEFMQAMRQQNPSLLQAKLKALNGG
jgi:uncharacterized protein (DUF433 family)